MASPIKLTPELQKRLIEKMKLEVEQEMAAGKPQERLGPSGFLEPTGDPQAAPPGYNSWQAFGRDYGVESGLLQRKLDEEAGIPPLPPLPGPSPEYRKAVSDIEDKYARDKADVAQKLFSWDTANVVNRAGAPAGSEVLLSRDTPESLTGKPVQSRLSYTPTRMTGESQWTEEDFDYEPSLNARVAVAKARYQSAMDLLGLRRQLEDPVSWSKSSGGSTSRTHDPAAMWERKGRLESAARQAEANVMKAQREYEKELSEKQIHFDKNVYQMPEGAQKEEVAEARAISVLPVMLESFANTLENLQKNSSNIPIDDFNQQVAGIVDTASAVISKGLSMGVLTDADAKRKMDQLSVVRLQPFGQNGVAVLKTLAAQMKDLARINIGSRGGRPLRKAAEAAKPGGK